MSISVDGGPSMILRLSGQHTRQGKTDIDQSHTHLMKLFPSSLAMSASGSEMSLIHLCSAASLDGGGGQEHWTIDC